MVTIPVNKVPKYRMITTFNAQITKWGFCLLGFVIGFLWACLMLTSDQPKQPDLADQRYRLCLAMIKQTSQKTVFYNDADQPSGYDTPSYQHISSCGNPFGIMESKNN